MSASTVRRAPYRREPEGVVEAELIPSACTDDSVAAHNRRDPYWDQLWAPGSQAVWATAAMARTRGEHGTGKVRAEFLLDQGEALERLLTGRGWKEKLACWAALDSWRTLTAEQMAAVTGHRNLATETYSSISASFSLGLLDIGTFSNPLANTGSTRSAIYRPGARQVFEDMVAPQLTWPEWFSVTGGQPWSNTGLHDRHNILTTELLLRAAEYLPVGAVLGEKFATVDLLAGTGLGKSLTKADNRRADGVIVREDGLRIAVELTASTSQGFESKVRRWAQLISERPLETSGLVVLFVAAPHPERTSRSGNDPRKGIYRDVLKVLREFPGTGPDSPAARIGVANWEEWFPGRHLLSEAFFNMGADFAVNDATGAERWQRRELLGDYAFTPWHTFDATAVIDNAPLLAATPHWLRAGDHTHLIGSPQERAGVTTPVPAPRRPELAKGRGLHEAVGAAGPAGLLPRLRITG
ncbi:hypothetical protein D477_014161 [Arthrobacter crystallopoietes BAB-32]|uniref:Uncharacterized protein n=1 Tax=Arthrobacter crystallopoietes BAB-32 TaxID=1246476 RepID=N1V0E0_9MICC|nr:hypothetical protein [Arthrobacter crystallopoietes]EMY33552.1 hypothetical protein D477_014161 [Arthrobacter crystallopoietes BAB-32]